MKVLSIAFLLLSLIVSTSANASLNDLEKAARNKVNAKPRVTLAEVKEIKNADALETANVPNYIKALAQNTKAAAQHANLVQPNSIADEDEAVKTYQETYGDGTYKSNWKIK